jgi:hypothetical protein
MIASSSTSEEKSQSNRKDVSDEYPDKHATSSSSEEDSEERMDRIASSFDS